MLGDHTEDYDYSHEVEYKKGIQYRVLEQCKGYIGLKMGILMSPE